MLQKLQNVLGSVFIYNWQARVYAFLILVSVVLTSTVFNSMADTKRGVTIESASYATNQTVSTSTEEIVNPNSVVKYGTEEEKLLNSQVLFPTTTGDEYVDGKIEEIFDEILTDDMSNYEKVLAIYSYVETNFNYSSSYISSSEDYVSEYDEKMVSRTQGILKTGHGTCTEFSALFMTMMRNVGFDCYCIKGSLNGGSHTWTVVILGEDKYLFDPQVDFRNWQRNGHVLCYDHFCQSFVDGNVKGYYAYNEMNNIWSFNSFETE